MMCLFFNLWQHLEKAAVAVVEAVEGAAEDHRTVRRSSCLLLLVSSRRRSGRCVVAGIDHFFAVVSLCNFFYERVSLCNLMGRRRACGYGFLFYSEMC